MAGYSDAILPSNAILELKNKKSPRGKTPRAEKFKGIIAYSGPSFEMKAKAVLLIVPI